MKKNKTGFSLAEVLIAVGIISVIATIGFTITKRNIDSAYDMYVYTGYQGISNAIAYANEEGQDITKKQVQFEHSVSEILDGNTDPNDSTFTKTPNGTSYRFTSLPERVINSIPQVKKHDYYITLRVPGPKIKFNNVTTTTQEICLLYMPDDNYGILLPVSTVGTCNSTIDDLNRRIDLLPFYIDNGEVGRVIGGNYVPKIYMSAGEALNGVFGISVNYTYDALKSSPSPSSAGAIRVENPRKAF